MICLKLIICVLFVNFFISQAANVLFLSIIPSPSHHIWNSAIANQLAKMGHNITVISPDVDINPPNNIHYILIENLYDDFHKGYFREVIRRTKKTNPFVEGLNLQKNNNIQCVETLKSKGFKALLNYPDDFHFDVVLYDFTLGPCLLPFVHKFNYPPLIATTAYGNPPCLSSVIGGHHYFSYIPHYSLVFDGNMSVLQRLFNLAIYLEEYVLRRYINVRAIDNIITNYFGPGIPSVGELEQKAKIALINTNPAIDFLAPLPENVIPVGGLHIKDSKPLPKDLELFINSANKGVVLFSLGTNIRSEYISDTKQQLFINVFGQMVDYHFVWKFESNNTATELPKNVKILPWIPQSDILAHPKLKAFITHGGLLSTQEAIWRGVPLIVVPFLFDQYTNLMKTKKAGIAEGLDFLTLTENEMKETLLKVLENQKYKRNAEELSRIFKDQPQKPLERAIWWIEWVIRNPDYEYFKSPVLQLGYFIGHSFDIICCVVLVLISAVFIFLTFFCSYINIFIKFSTKNLSNKNKKEN